MTSQKPRPIEHPLSAADMDQPPYRGDRRAYMICSGPRSGSTLLCRLLIQTERLGIPHEYFHWEQHAREMMTRLGVLADYDGKIDYAALGRYVPLLLERRTTANGVFAVKCHFNQIVPLAQAGLIDRYFPGLAFVYMVRRDLLAQAISLTIAAQTRRWHSYETAAAEPRYDAQHIDRAMTTLLNFETGWRRYFALRGVEPVTVTYEDLVADPVATCAAIARLVGETGDLGIAPDRVDSPRLATGINADWAERYRRDRAGAAAFAPPAGR